MEPLPAPIFKSSRNSTKRSRRRGGNPRLCRFVISLVVDEPRDPAHAWLLARHCEEILRERVPDGVEINPVEFRVTRVQGKAGSEAGRRWSAGVKAVAKSDLEARQQAEASRRLEEAAARHGEDVEEIDWL
jgi:hypothetical protein